ncbi:MAG: AAA family ATPase [Promethearchaeota archaeon]
MRRPTTMNTAITNQIIQPGNLTVLWGRSSTGKTILCLDLAITHAKQGNPVLYFTDDRRDLEKKFTWFEGKNAFNDAELAAIDANIRFIPLETFDHQFETLKNLPYFFTPKRSNTKPSQYIDDCNLFGIQMNEKVIEILKRVKNPTLLIFDEFTRHYQAEAIQNNDPGGMYERMAFLFAILKNTIDEFSIPAITTSASRTEGIKDERGNIDAYTEGPVAGKLVEFYADTIMHLQHSETKGEISIHCTKDEHGKQDIRKYIELDEIYNTRKERRSEVMNQ